MDDMTFPMTQVIGSVSQSSNESDPDIIYGYLSRVDQNDVPVRTYALNKTTVTIRRKRSNDILLTDNTISSKHCEIGKYIMHSKNTSATCECMSFVCTCHIYHNI